MPDGGNLTVTIAADPGYHVVDVLVDAASVGVVASYDFTGVVADHSLDASFAPDAVGALHRPRCQHRAHRQRRGWHDACCPDLVGRSGQLDGGGLARGLRELPALRVRRVTRGIPSVPASYPPSSPWVLTAVTTSGETDDVPQRDFYYYVAYVTNEFGTRSPVSNLSNGALNYALGDVYDGAAEGSGNNVVDLADISLLGFHYGISGAAADLYAYLDIGPTTDSSPTSMPVPDGVIDFEDFVFFGMNYQLTSRPFGARRAADPALARTLRLERVDEGDALRVRVWASNAQDVAAASLRLTWNAGELEPIAGIAGPVPALRGALAMSAAPGALDLYSGEGLAGDADGELPLATFSFRRKGASDAEVQLARGDLRDATNARLPVLTPGLPDAVPAYTALAAPSPNPSREVVSFAFALAHESEIDLSLHGVDGRRVLTLSHARLPAGQHVQTWNGRDTSGRIVPPGVYYLRLTSSEGTYTRRFVRIH